MADITPVSLALTGANPALASANAGGDSIINTKANATFIVNNGSGSSINVTFAAQQNPRPTDGTFPAMTLSNNVVAVPAGGMRLIGPIPSAFNDGNGKVQVTYSAVSSVTVGAFIP